jgi:hypothetical protein
MVKTGGSNASIWIVGGSVSPTLSSEWRQRLSLLTLLGLSGNSRPSA